MKAWIALAMVIPLAGCGQATHPMDPYMMDVLDAPDACYYVSVDEEPWATAAAYAGIEANPGSADNQRMRLAGVAPQTNRVAAMECGFGDEPSQYLSVAVGFGSAADARAWLGAVQTESAGLLGGARCTPHALVFDDGDVIGFIATLSDTWHPAFQESAQQRFAQILDDTGAKDYCA